MLTFYSFIETNSEKLWGYKNLNGGIWEIRFPYFFWQNKKRKVLEEYNQKYIMFDERNYKIKDVFEGQHHRHQKNDILWSCFYKDHVFIVCPVEEEHV